MKIFEKENSSWNEKVNFIDDNDVFVGYDMGQCCCEDAGYFIAEKVTPYRYGIQQGENYEVEDYYFDKNFFEHVPSIDLDCGLMVAFRLVSYGKPDLYLHLYNAHNGYYGHGFEVKHGGEEVISQYI